MAMKYMEIIMLCCVGKQQLLCSIIQYVSLYYAVNKFNFTTMHFTAVRVDSLQVYNSLSDGKWACEEEPVDFTCAACFDGHGLQSWSSDQYIDAQGTGRQLTFATIDSIGNRQNGSINPEENYAVLTNKTQNGDTLCLESTLHIKVSKGESSQNQSVVCSSTSTDSLSNKIVIRTLGNLTIIAKYLFYHYYNITCSDEWRNLIPLLMIYRQS